MALPYDLGDLNFKFANDIYEVQIKGADADNFYLKYDKNSNLGQLNWKSDYTQFYLETYKGGILKGQFQADYMKNKLWLEFQDSIGLSGGASWDKSIFTFKNGKDGFKADVGWTTKYYLSTQELELTNTVGWTWKPDGTIIAILGAKGKAPYSIGGFNGTFEFGAMVQPDNPKVQGAFFNIVPTMPKAKPSK